MLRAYDNRRRISASTPLARRLPRVRPLPRDEPPVPAQERIGGNDRGDLAQPPTAQAVRPAAQDTILLNEIAGYFSLPAVQPPGEEGEQQLERRGVNHGGNLYHGPGSHVPFRPSIQPWDITGTRRDLQWSHLADTNRKPWPDQARAKASAVYEYRAPRGSATMSMAPESDSTTT